MAKKNLLVLNDEQARDTQHPAPHKFYRIISSFTNKEGNSLIFPFHIDKPEHQCVYECETDEVNMTCTLGSKIT